MATNYANIAQAIATIGQVVAGISDMNKRRKFEQTLSLFNSDQQVALSEKLMRAQSLTDRIGILTKTIADFTIEQEKVKSTKDIRLIIVAGGLVTVLIVVALIYVLKRKKG